MAIGPEQRYAAARTANVCEVNGSHLPRSVLFDDAVCR
jgi:hypothetical protein